MKLTHVYRSRAIFFWGCCHCVSLHKFNCLIWCYDAQFFKGLPVSSALFSKRLKQNWPQLFTLLYHVDHHEIHIFIISWWFSSQFPGYITNQFNDQLPDGLLAQLVRELHRYHRWSSLLLYLHSAVLIHEFHLFIFSCHLVFQILLCLTTLIWKIMINLLWGLPVVGSLVKSWLPRRLEKGALGDSQQSWFFDSTSVQFAPVSVIELIYSLLF